jgi:3-oxoacyl-[acyl-carrier protein] reductase
MQKVALITGGSRGIGFGIASEFAAAGHNLVLSGRRECQEVEPALTELRNLGARVSYCASDIADSSDRRMLLDEVRKSYGRVDVLVNNAGVAPEQRRDILDVSEESFETLLRVNLQGPFFLSQAVAAWMLELRAADPDFRGTIINISSISAEIVSLNRAEYCVSKAGVSMMTKLFAARLCAHGMAVFEIRPGIIRSDMTKAATEKYNRLITESDLCVVKRWGMPRDIGEVALAMAEGRLPYCVGQVITVDGGLSLKRL